ncbi:MAG: 50S ribosomal protein L4 [Candidatus Latescibacteria bacterium]|nr:50S ribosomal protein L4 [Candidatus Latescibacterota bacterium]NIM20825.1 50S ribosomal protein L4 [Candidatus Latescibacterota bacterium]NIM64391.1 50S ribosomal protein L4 [Candidatus Latescibacterota bacterium]NIO00542.1 50S ribosomal protein L4 [Candidatus Latescibacterota bacterium]NIO26945.1 50S ribosomal protein L4 [Candidatus Latescibacterota bacterium]
MATAKWFEKDGTEKGTRELPDSLFGCEVNEHAVHEAVVAYLANQRQGAASAKGRSEIAGGGGKPYRQKGTGRARAGTIRSPIWRGGGVVFGPHPRDYRINLPKKVKRLALRSALSARAKEGSVMLISDLDYTEPKTKMFASLLKNMDSHQQKILFVIDKTNVAVVKSARNIPGVKVVLGSMLTTYDVVWAEKVILTESAVKVMEEVFKSE